MDLAKILKIVKNTRGSASGNHTISSKNLNLSNVYKTRSTIKIPLIAKTSRIQKAVSPVNTFQMPLDLDLEGWKVNESNEMDSSFASRESSTEKKSPTLAIDYSLHKQF